MCLVVSVSLHTVCAAGRSALFCRCLGLLSGLFRPLGLFILLLCAGLPARAAGPLCFAAALHRALELVRADHPGMLLAALHDDVELWRALRIATPPLV